MSNADESAFPVPGMEGPNSNWIWPTNGLTKREYFAAMAMQGLLASETSEYEYRDTDKGTREQNVAVGAVKQADALLAELAKPVQP